jgi:AraC family transcriptional regulator
MRSRDLLCLIREIQGRLGDDVSLGRLARRAGWSPFHLQRAFQSLVGETPKQYTQRLRLERAAATLLVGTDTVTDVARSTGFRSHEVFSRAFRRRFGCAPALYRRRALAGVSPRDRARHAQLIAAAGPCIRLFHLPISLQNRKPNMPTLSITRQERPAQPILFIRRRVARGELQATLAECFGKLFEHGQKAGLAIAGFPLARYVTTGPGLWTVESAIPLAAPANGEGEMQAGFLHAGAVALGIHGGVYDDLHGTHAAIERWIEEKGYRVAGPPWEWYVTDPGELPNPADWRTEVYWPLAE